METPVNIAPSPECGAIRVTGKVKWFDPVKGYGFIVSRDVLGDVLLHRSVMVQFGRTEVPEGATIECDVVQKSRGFQAARVHRMDEPAIAASNGHAGNGSAGRFSRSADLPDPTGPTYEGVCKFFGRPRGYGFIVVGGIDGDIFVHMDVLRKYHVRELKQGQKVLVRFTTSSKGLIATEVHLAPERAVSSRPRLVSPAEFGAVA